MGIGPIFGSELAPIQTRSSITRGIAPLTAILGESVPCCVSNPVIPIEECIWADSMHSNPDIRTNWESQYVMAAGRTQFGFPNWAQTELKRFSEPSTLAQ